MTDKEWAAAVKSLWFQLHFMAQDHEPNTAHESEDPEDCHVDGCAEAGEILHRWALERSDVSVTSPSE